ncbi:MAG: M28 family peptidase [Bryobacteraceae bacterium]
MRALSSTFITASLFTAITFAQSPIRGFKTADLPAQRERELKASALPSPERLRTYMERMATAPHAAGSAGSKAVAEYALAQMKDWGLDANIERFDALLPYPTVRLLEIPGFKAQLSEPALAEDPDTAITTQLPLFNAYAASGDVTAQLIYVNYGTPEDYAYLDAMGISLKGKIAIARYGRVWRGLKPKLAQDHGAVGCLIYSDPRDDGFYIDNPYPEGPMRPAQGAQRGSVMDMALYTGDPLTPGWASEPGAKRLDREDARSLLKIPVLPISWADAQPLLDKLQGPLAPESWRGALSITYHLGPSSVPAHLKVDFDWTDKPLYNVIATIPGTTQKDQWIIYGNHHDAWVTGASDPVSGAAALMETARVLSVLKSQGWQPKRTIKLALWDGEEFGLVGSTEWVEKHAKELDEHGAVYLNTDSNGTGMMSAAGSPALETFLDEVFRDNMDPSSGRTILESINQTYSGGARPNQPTPDAPLGSLGSGSDYVGFLHHIGIASLNLGFGAAPGQYHSNYDTVRFFNRFSDGDRRFGVALTQVMATAILRLADAPVLPFEFDTVSEMVIRQLDEIRSQIPQTAIVDFKELQASVTALNVAAHAYETAYAAAMQRANVPASANEVIERTERAFLAPEGLPDRDWYKHQLYAPGLLTGYTAKTLPGVREAVEAKNWIAANEQAQRLAATLKAAAKQIEAAAQALQQTK